MLGSNETVAMQRAHHDPIVQIVAVAIADEGALSRSGRPVGPCGRPMLRSRMGCGLHSFRFRPCGIQLLMFSFQPSGYAWD